MQFFNDFINACKTVYYNFQYFISLDLFGMLKYLFQNINTVFFVVAVGTIVYFLMRLFVFPEKKSKVHGSATWGDINDVKKKKLVCSAGERVLLGKIGGDFIGSPYHSLVCAKTRAGKGVGIIIPTLLTYKGSIICNDVKGENYVVTTERRERMGQEVYCIDLYGEVTDKTHCYNPLDSIAIGYDKEAITKARGIVETIAECLAKTDAFFQEYGKVLVTAVVLYVSAKYTGTERTLNKVRSLLTSKDSEKMAMFSEMQEMEEYDNNIQKTANMVVELLGEDAAKEKNVTILGVFANAAVVTAFLDDKNISDVLSKSDFDFSMFRYEPSTLYFVVKPSRKVLCNLLLRLLYSASLEHTMTNKKPVQAQEAGLERMKYPLVYLMDEFAQLMSFPIVKDALPVAAGYGINFCIIVQGLMQLQEHYDKGSGEFTTNCLKLFMGAEDTQTAGFISDMCGDATVEAYSFDDKGKKSTSFVQRKLITVGEVLQSEAEEPFLLAGGMRPLRIERITYHEDSFFKKLGYGKYTAG